MADHHGNDCIKYLLLYAVVLISMKDAIENSFNWYFISVRP